jgi:hypothetical protein
MKSGHSVTWCIRTGLRLITRPSCPQWTDAKCARLGYVRLFSKWYECHVTDIPCTLWFYHAHSATCCCRMATSSGHASFRVQTVALRRLQLIQAACMTDSPFTVPLLVWVCIPLGVHAPLLQGCSC